MLAVGRSVDRRTLGAGFVTALCVVVLLTLAGPVPEASAAPGTCGIPGADGPQPTLGGTVNTYFPGTSASVTTGATSLAIGASIGASTPIAVGDKVLIMQMQSADLNAANTDAYGDGVVGEPPNGATNWASAGTYEFAVAANTVGTSGGTLQLSAGTQNAYARSAATASKGQQTFQVVRVPQYSSATLTSDITATPWNGAAGGIVVLDVAGILDLNGFRIDVSASGFRGGAGRALSGGSGGASTDIRTSASNAFNGGKAEGIAGTPRYVFNGATTTDTGVEGYPNGSFARGAPANAGGGGTDGNPAANDQNSGGGGGANGGAGGRGGNSWSSNLAVGGAGGAAVPAPSATNLVLGGGGGGATRNNAGPSSGGVGAGLVMLDIGSLAGTGEIRANGSDGQTAANDGGGGGGAGGSVVVAATSGSLSGLTVNANGGAGGNAWPTQAPSGFPGERHGPGGGGGGGIILYSAPVAATSTAGGAHGVTTTANDAYNATDGSGGSANTFVGSLPGAGNASSCAPQLTVTKTTSTADVTNTPSGTTATYTIAVTNAAGRDTAQEVALSDVLPTGLAFAATGAVTLGGGATRPLVVDPSTGATAPSWSRFTIPGGGSVSLTFTVDVASSVAASTLQNPATATYLDPSRTTVGGTTAASYDPASSAGEDVRVRWPDLTIAKSHSASFSRGDSATYTVTATNSGDATSSGSVTVTDVLPVGLTPTLAGGTGWACGIVTQTVTCTRSDALAGGASYPVVTVTVTVALSVASSITNTATIAGGNEQVTGNNSASDPTTIAGSSDLSITKTSSPSPYSPGSTITYTITVRNNGPLDVAGAAVDDVVPASVTGVTWTCAIGGGTGACASASGSGNAIATTLDLANGAVATLTVTGTVAPGTTGILSNTASVSAPSGITDPSPGNNSATNDNSDAPAQSDLQIRISPSSSSGLVGSSATFAIDVQDNGPDQALNVEAVITLPSGFAVGSITGTGWSCSATLNVVTCDLAGPLGASTSAPSITLQATLPGAAGGYTISATVGSTTPDTNSANNTATALVTAGTPQPPSPPRADLSLTKTTPSAVATSGDQISYALVVQNRGPDTATTVTVTDTLPAELTFGSATGDGWACANTGATITCTRAQLASGATSSVTVVVTAARGGTITNSARVSATTLDPNTADNVGSATVQIASRVDLAVSKTASAPTFVGNKPLAFTIVIGNTGPDDVAGAQISDLAPAPLNNFTWTCSAVLARCGDLAGMGSIAQTVDIQAGGSVTYRLTGIVTQQSITTITNRVTVSAPSAVVDVDPSNNAATARVRRGSQSTRLEVAVTPRVATMTSGEPEQFTVRTTNTGTSVADGVITCLTIPAGATVARAAGGYLVRGRYCWRRASLAPGKAVQYVISILGDRRQAQRLALVASATARNAPVTHAEAHVKVLAAVKKTTGGYTG